MDAAAALDTTTPDIPPSISASKHSRIDIWRNEVASALIPDPSSPLSPDSSSLVAAAPSFTSSSAATTNTGSTHQPSRTRRLLSRIGRRLTGRSAAEDAALEDVTTRTAMYSTHLPPPPQDAAAATAPVDGAAAEDEVVPGEASSRGGAAPGLKETQERLMRAARLLDQSPRT